MSQSKLFSSSGKWSKTKLSSKSTSRRLSSISQVNQKESTNLVQAEIKPPIFKNTKNIDDPQGLGPNPP